MSLAAWAADPSELEADKVARVGRRFVVSKPFVSSAVIGASSMQQLAEVQEAAAQGPLPDDVLEAIDSIHQRFPNPTP